MRDDYLQRYRELYQRHWWWRAREKLILETLRAEQPPGGWKSILDVGCGDGLFFDQLTPFGDVEGVEPSAASVSDQGPHRSRIHIGPFDENFQPRKEFKLILMLDVLEHLADPAAALRRALALLAPGGMLLVTVPAFNALWTNHDLVNEHVTRYTRRTFRELARQAGLAIQTERYFFQWLFPLKLATRGLERAMDILPRPASVPPGWINTPLYLLSLLEQYTWGALPWPFGSSLMVWGSKP
ncbi:MAG TPA: class I SAM-dependent methyltransferase [Terriglobia bacterium]|nr:class I SAM-dependent methyltransferase [Terriglobia bacterium]